jgi:hypothetical protein
MKKKNTKAPMVEKVSIAKTTLKCAKLLLGTLMLSESWKS